MGIMIDFRRDGAKGRKFLQLPLPSYHIVKISHIIFLKCFPEREREKERERHTFIYLVCDYSFEFPILTILT